MTPEEIHAMRPNSHIDVRPREFRGTNSCSACACRWKIDDLSERNPKEDLCNEPLKWHPNKCYCHSEPWVMGYLDQRDKMHEEVVGQI